MRGRIAGIKSTDGYYMFVIPRGVAKVDEGDDGDEEVNRKLEHFKIWTTHVDNKCKQLIDR